MRRRAFAYRVLLTLAINVAVITSAAAASGPAYWQPVDTDRGASSVPDRPSHYRTFHLDEAGLEADLNTSKRVRRARRIRLPLPDGSLATFDVEPVQTMDASLAARNPQLHTYTGSKLDDPSTTVRLLRAPGGVDAIILGKDGSSFVRPSFAAAGEHVAYDWNDVPTAPLQGAACSVPSRSGSAAPASRSRFKRSNQSYDTGMKVRQFRLALVAQGEFSQENGGTVASVRAALVAKVNHLNAIFERELSIRLVLVDDGDQLIYLDPNTDPWPSGCSMDVFAVHNRITEVIGTSGFDHGLILTSQLCGGAAYLPSACNDSLKGAAFCGSAIDVLAHNVGHQFGLQHTWNSQICATNFGGHELFNAYEPGSGSTIMSNAGLCGADDVAKRRLLQFHVRNFDQALAFASEEVANCPTVIDTGNHAPVVVAGTASVTFPISTPFALVGSATDADADPLLYAWQEVDLPAAASAPNSGMAPFFRVTAKTSDPSRTFPPIGDVINNVVSLGEQLPASTQMLNFRLEVWDHHDGAGGVTYDSVGANFDTAAGPFRVSSQSSATTWASGAIETVTWDVANTDQPPVSCATVNIDLSTDGGYTFPLALAHGVANDGSETITVPNTSGSGRVRVRCASLPDHFFFDVSDANITFSAPCSPPTTVVSNFGDSGPCSLRQVVADAADGAMITFAGPGTVSLDSQVTIAGKNLSIDGGTYDVAISGQDKTRMLWIEDAAVELHRLTLTHGKVSNGYGGAVSVHNLNAATSLLCDHCAIRSNEASCGGGVYNDSATVSFVDSTVAANIGTDFACTGGAVYATNGILNLKRSTVSGNSSLGPVVAMFSANALSPMLTAYNSTISDNAGGGVFLAGGSADLKNSTLADNAAFRNTGGLHLSAGATATMGNTILDGNAPFDCYDEAFGAGVQDVGGNHVSASNTCAFMFAGAARLAPLQDNGGPTQTRTSLAGSPVQGSGDPAVCNSPAVGAVDQRGSARPVSGCDKGAFQAICGDGVLSEPCEIGVSADGECCTATCQLQAPGTACNSDANGCTDDVCNGAGVCSHPDNAVSCDDGVFCNGVDQCGGGACSQHAGDPCSAGSECANLCNEGADNCFNSAGSACSDGNICTSDECDGAGTCAHTNNTVGCDDGLFCNGSEICSGGACAHSGDPCAGGAECANSCNEAADSCFIDAGTLCTDDGNVCTDDRCNGMGACLHPSNTATCDDDQFCNGSDTCSGGSCSQHSGDPCSSGPQCANSCNEIAGNCFNGNGTACGSDANVCTDDQCDGAGTCAHLSNTANCDDGLFCNGSDTCSGGACAQHSGDPCSGGGSCAHTCNESAGNCFHGTGSACPDDGNLCTDDQCNGSGTCTHPDNTAACDDGVFCNGGDTCGSGSCSQHAGDPCAGGAECLTTCNEAAGDCKTPLGELCSEDGTLCTADECDGEGMCTHFAAPRTKCIAAAKATMSIKNNLDDGRDTVSFSFTGEEIPYSTLGNPTALTPYALCVYDANGLVFKADLPPAGLCDEKQCWRAKKYGFTYKDKAASKGGVSTLKILAKPTQTKLRLKGKGVDLDEPLNAALALPVRVQVLNSGKLCAEVLFSTVDQVRKNDELGFKARE